MRLLTRITNNFANISVPIVDITKFLSNQSSAPNDCKEVANALHKYGCLIIKDPRVNQKQNDSFLDLMEKYFSQRADLFYSSHNCPDIHPQQNYQVGATPQFTQIAKEHSSVIERLSKENRPSTPSPPPPDAKWRYFWNISELNPALASKQIPKDFPEFKQTMDAWGSQMLDGCFTVARMAALGLDLPKDTFANMLQGGPHKLAPTGSDLLRYPVGTIFAGFHYDFNFLSIHGKSRYPGLFAWLRTGEKFSVAVPEGHLLLQAGKQFEWLTGGYINCGYHEVVYTQKVRELRDQALKEGRIPWRISSTLFSHVRYDTILEPIGKHATDHAIKQYPKIVSAEHTKKELEDINLKQHD